MDTKAVENYKMRRAARLEARGYHADVEEENNSNNRSSSGSGHGNTRLPFGLCRRLGIEVGSDWTPRDAWDALADKGITPAGEFSRLSGDKNTVKSKSGTVYSNLKAEKSRYGGYTLKGDHDMKTFSGAKKRMTDSTIQTFVNKEEMYSFLKENGVKSFKDPDTGEKVNPSTMDLPRTVGKHGDRRFVDVVIGYRRERTGHPYSGKGITIVGKGYDGKKYALGSFKTEEEARKFADGMGVKPEDLRETKDFKEYKRTKAA